MACISTLETCTGQCNAMIRKNAGLPSILLRKTVITEDVSLIPVIGGIITSAEGVTAHAAVLAQKFHVTAVVACSDMAIETNEQANLT
jgi:phosphohistidine swiveling domain-containing protein